AGDRRLPHAAQPARIFSRPAGRPNHPPPGLPRRCEEQGMVAVVRGRRPGRERVPQISGRAGAQLDRSPGRPMTSLRSFLFNILFALWTAFIFVASLPTLVLPRGACWWMGGLWVRGALLLLGRSSGSGTACAASSIA